MPSKIKFLVASNPRSGSTWLESMLGALPDTHVDYELIWKPDDPSYDLVKPIEDASFRCGEFLASLSEQPVVGAKLLLELSGYTPDEYESLRHTVEPDVRVIHLTRRYESVFYSWQRGVYKHARNQDTNGDTVIDRDMQQRADDLSEYDARMRDLEVESRWKQQRRLADLPAIARIRARRQWAQLRARLAGREHQDFWGSRRSVAREDCTRLAQTMLDNDRWIDGLQRDREHFVTIDYAEIGDRFGELARFVGSQASDAEVQAILDEPPTVALNKVDIQDFFENADELVEICSDFDRRKQAALGNDRS